MIEMAFTLPVFIILLFGTVEISNLVYAQQKAQSAAENILNIINLQDNVSTDQLRSMAEMLPEIAKPMEVADNQYLIIITSMQRDTGGTFAYVNWQKEFGNSSAGTSKFRYNEASTDEENMVTPDDLDGFVFFEGDQVLIIEAFMYYKPLLDNDLTEQLYGLRDSYLYSVTPPYRPRVGSFQFHPDDLI